MTHQPTMPAVEYRQLWSRLVEMRQLDPEDAELRALQHDFVRIGLVAGLVSRAVAAGEESDETQLRADINWDHDEIPLSAQESAIVDQVAEVTNVPE